MVYIVISEETIQTFKEFVETRNLKGLGFLLEELEMEMETDEITDDEKRSLLGDTLQAVYDAKDFDYFSQLIENPQIQGFLTLDLEREFFNLAIKERRYSLLKSFSKYPLSLSEDDIYNLFLTDNTACYVLINQPDFILPKMTVNLLEKLLIENKRKSEIIAQYYKNLPKNPLILLTSTNHKITLIDDISPEKKWTLPEIRKYTNTLTLFLETIFQHYIDRWFAESKHFESNGIFAFDKIDEISKEFIEYLGSLKSWSPALLAEISSYTKKPMRSWYWNHIANEKELLDNLKKEFLISESDDFEIDLLKKIESSIDESYFGLSQYCPDLLKFTAQMLFCRLLDLKKAKSDFIPEIQEDTNFMEGFNEKSSSPKILTKRVSTWSLTDDDLDLGSPTRTIKRKLS